MSTGTQLIFCNVPAREAGALLPFYTTLLGVDSGSFVHNGHSPVDQYETPISASGVDLLITQRNEDREVTTTYWSVRDLDASIEELKNLGGDLVSGPTKMPDGGRTAALLDPEGNYVGLVELAGHAQEYFQLGKGGDRLARRRKQLRSALAGR